MPNSDKKIFQKNIKTAPILIAGPCSAETKQQLTDTAEEISRIKRVKIFRAGVWKPRTRPGSFEGAGAKALPWLREIKDKYKFKIAVEVAKPEHVEECLKYPDTVDVVWLGARTTGNPFSVQAIADSLRGTNMAVLIKNPINPDLDLWLGATQRILNAGITDVGAIHRGFYPFSKTFLRNLPKWEIPINYMMQFPEIPMINDPSHIAGDIDYIHDVAQRALNTNFDGLMIETHISPKDALSDAKQQLTPTELDSLIDKLVFRQKTSTSPQFFDLLHKYRDQIDSIDFQIIELLNERMEIIKNIGKYKSEYNVSVFQLKRWRDVLASRIEFCDKFDLSKPFVEKVLSLVHEESIRQQSFIMNEYDDDLDYEE